MVYFIEDIVSLEKTVEPVAGSEAEEPPQLCFRDVIALVFLESQPFESAARQIATGGGEPGSNVIRNVNSHVHVSISSSYQRKGYRPGCHEISTRRLTR